MPPLKPKNRPIARVEASETKPRHLDVFQAYAAFKSLPGFLRYPPKDKNTGTRPTPREFAVSLGIEDEMALELIDLQTQKKFAERFGITEQTLGRWNKLLTTQQSMEDIAAWIKPLSKNVLFALYAQILSGKALPEHYKLWFKVVNGWSDKQAVDLNRRTIKTVQIEVVEPSKV